METALFPLGQTVITRTARDELHPEDITLCVARHARGEWGDLGADDLRANQIALAEGLRLLSAYSDRNGVRFWIITEADRSATTVLLPDDY
jgi:hypothetical protein